MTNNMYHNKSLGVILRFGMGSGSIHAGAPQRLFTFVISRNARISTASRFEERRGQTEENEGILSDG